MVSLYFIGFKEAILNGKRIAYHSSTVFQVQVGKRKGAYKTRWSFTGNLSQALTYYNGLNVHSGFKKRLLAPSMNKPILDRVITN